MVMPIVHRFEVVNVLHEQGHGVIVPLGTLYFSSQISMKFPTIKQFGEAISCGHLLEPASHTVKDLGKSAKFVGRDLLSTMRK
jgi:hypothetical protein